MTFSRIICLIITANVFFFSCKKDEKNEAESIQMQLVSENLDKQLLACKSAAEVQNFLNKNPYLTKVYFTDLQIAPDQLASYLYGILENTAFQSFASQLDSIIGDRNSVIIQPLQNAFKNIKYNFPGFEPPKIKLMISGFTGNDLYISDSLIIIGLDYFGGPRARFRPNVFDYQLRRYQKEYIVPSIVFFISDRFNKTDPTDKTLLGDMVGYGKGYEFVKQTMPETPDSLILGYSADNLAKTYNSQQQIWAYFITSKLLYESSDLRKKKYIEDRPFTTEIGNKVPGAIGRWVGWRIVSRYMSQHPETSLPELMQMDNAAGILQESGYKGEPDEEE